MRQTFLSPDELAAISQCCGMTPSEVALRLKPSPTLRPQVVATQVDCMRRLRLKVPSWSSVAGLYIPSALATQQCSSEAVARWRKGFVFGDSLVDLTGGLGVDCFFMSRGVKSAVHTEPNAELQSAVQNNFSLMGADNVKFLNMTAEQALESLTEPVGTIFIDPSRRSESASRVFRIEDCSPDVAALADAMTAKAHVVLVKLSSLLDIKSVLGALPFVTDIYVVGVDGECKDLLVRMCRLEAVAEPTIHSVMVGSDGGVQEFSFLYSEESEATCQIAQAFSVGDYLYEPSSVMMKAGPYSLISQRFGVEQLALMTHLYVSRADGGVVEGFPGRSFVIRELTDLSKQGVRRLKESYPKASIAVRNFRMSPEEVRKKTGIRDGDSVYIFCASVGRNDVVFVCEKVC